MRLGQGPTQTNRILPPHPQQPSEASASIQSESKHSSQEARLLGLGQDPDGGLGLTKCGGEQLAPRDLEHSLLPECVTGTTLILLEEREKGQWAAAKTPSSPAIDKLVTLREPWSPCVGKEEAGDFQGLLQEGHSESA